MILILCVDNDMGTSFGGKRQSRDREVTRAILKAAKGSVLWTDTYSGKLLLEAEELFSEDTVAPGDIRVDDECLIKAGEGEYCFVELTDVSACTDRAEEIILFHWNRDYPSTAKFAMPEGYTLTESREFPGYSHEVITEETFTR